LKKEKEQIILTAKKQKQEIEIKVEEMKLNIATYNLTIA